ncbi:LysR family transcriptional regulator [Paraburkholderia acidisoli]|uniref:LysR family transcriptional regulator n=1 Tax=Paraburkholderia acidisoli TaxID=2571748 RepID=A0A7Z2JI95_9BURK|nr:LysR family transcriptional regulator [Paraburkholderia acidisoli]QGZ66682.1 LysR family transcriptional regulator [Paraburkholderia acidisoli]
MSTRFDIDALRTMVTGVNAGSFARAATQLGRSQSAVSMQLKRLEEQAGQTLFERQGRGLALTEAGDALLAYARQIVALHDEAAAALNARPVAATLRLGLPQDFFETVMPRAVTRFAKLRPDVHVEVRAGRNYALEEEVQAGKLDLALAFAQPGQSRSGTRLAMLPLGWYAGKRAPDLADRTTDVPLVLFDHPCLFRQTALRALDQKRRAWRLALTTPSLPGVWAALRFGHGVTVRTAHAVPRGVQALHEAGLPRLPALELRLHERAQAGGAAAELRDVLVAAVGAEVS